MMHKKFIPTLKISIIGLVIAIFMSAGCSDSSTSSTTTTDSTKADTALTDSAETRPIKTPD